MKLFLSSISIQPQNREAFLELVGIEKADIRLALIENGADTYAPDKRAWVERAYQLIVDTVGAQAITRIDLRQFVGKSKELEDELKKYNIVWVGGGNVFYLRWIARESGFDVVIPELVRDGMVYGGDSAGAILAGPRITGFESADSPEDAPEIIDAGIGLIDQVPIPHSDHDRYAPLMERIEQQFRDEHYETIPIKDSQAIVVDDKSTRIVGV